jgi:hypothetical protein
MAWYAVHDANGKLCSIGTVMADTLPQGLVAVELPGGKPADDRVWDEMTRSFVARPAKTLRDRLQDILEHADYADLQSVWQSLSPAQRQALRNALIRLLGRERWRNASEPIEIGGEVGRG